MFLAEVSQKQFPRRSMEYEAHLFTHGKVTHDQTEPPQTALLKRFRIKELKQYTIIPCLCHIEMQY